MIPLRPEWTKPPAKPAPTKPRDMVCPVTGKPLATQWSGVVVPR